MKSQSQSQSHARVYYHHTSHTHTPPHLALTHTPHLALKVYPVPSPPHVSLDGLSREDRSGKASLDGLELGHIIPSKVAKDIAGSNTK